MGLDVKVNLNVNFKREITPRWSFEVSDIQEKLNIIELNVHQALLSKSDRLTEPLSFPREPARDLRLCGIRDIPSKKPGLSTPAGLSRLFHDLANIELQAMEIGLRELLEFPEPIAPSEFREELAALVLSEAAHLRLCLEMLNDLGASWGDWPIHSGLWAGVDLQMRQTEENTNKSFHLIQRVLVVHRHMEGAGLDAGSNILRRLSGVGHSSSLAAVKRISSEEIQHVEFGSRWFRRLCARENINPTDEFKKQMPKIMQISPRSDPMDYDLRRQAGFNDTELSVLDQLIVRRR